jgi:hypothetical protein
MSQIWWTCAIEDRKAGRTRLVKSDEKILHDNQDYGDVHIVPCTEQDENYDFGAHEFNRHCYCRPRIQIQEGKRPMIIHELRKAN